MPHISLPAAVMLEGKGIDDRLKNAAYVMEMELLSVATGVEPSQLIAAVPLEYRQETCQPHSICLVPCTSNRQKMWPLEYWYELAQFYLAQAFHVDVVPGPDERDLADYFPAGCCVHANQPWPKVCDVFRTAALVNANDCGPMHVAAYVTGRVLAIFGPTDPAVWFPYHSRQSAFIKSDIADWPTVEAVCAETDRIMKEIDKIDFE